MIQRIAFQGELGAFSHVAARQLTDSTWVPVPFQSFEDVFQAVRNGKCQAAAIPIENTLHGSVHENYDLLLKYDLAIRGETFVRIVHNLIAAPRVSFGNIRKVFSHPVALNQCKTFFENHPLLEKTSFYDTAGSVKMIMETLPTDAGAIASADAAKIYGGKILRKSIEDDQENYTRFFRLERAGRKKKEKKKEESVAGPYKTTLVFTTKNLPGALFRSLSAFSLRDLNLTKIESRPLRGKPWEYLFYLDFIGHVDDPVSQKALGHLAEVADFLRILGCYPAASLKKR